MCPYYKTAFNNAAAQCSFDLTTIREYATTQGPMLAMHLFREMARESQYAITEVVRAFQRNAAPPRYDFIFGSTEHYFPPQRMRGVIDSPPDQSAALRELDVIEKQLRTSESDGLGGFSVVEQHERIRDALWTFLLDVVCTPLWVRVRAAALLNVCFTIRRDFLRVEHQNAYWIRSIVSSTCQVLEEMDATERRQEQNLFTWLEFLENMLLATPSDVVRTRLCDDSPAVPKHCWIKVPTCVCVFSSPRCFAIVCTLGC